MNQADYKNFYANKFKSPEDLFVKVEPVEIREENGVRVEVYKPGRGY